MTKTIFEGAQQAAIQSAEAGFVPSPDQIAGYMLAMKNAAMALPIYGVRNYCTLYMFFKFRLFKNTRIFYISSIF